MQWIGFERTGISADTTLPVAPWVGAETRMIHRRSSRGLPSNQGCL